MPVNPRSLQNLVNVKLESGVTSEVHRVRAAGDVQDWFKAMTAEERGELLARVMTSLTTHPHQAAVPAFAEGESTTPPVRGITTARTAPKKKEPTQSKQADSKPEQLRVLTATIERSVRGKLRWDKERYTQVEELLAEGSVLTRQTDGADWVTEKGGVASWRTVDALLKFSVLVG
ncbi:hypothetical protein ACMT4L_20510 [Deinococcus sp. A31D244]|uniref:hypothetical protein n=1 Tax=Deinococcus sp. A31D244 TaxID=3397675 RepID=UPI0039E17480